METMLPKLWARGGALLLLSVVLKENKVWLISPDVSHANSSRVLRSLAHEVWIDAVVCGANRKKKHVEIYLTSKTH